MGPCVLLLCLLCNDWQLSDDEKEKLQNLVYPLFSLCEVYIYTRLRGSRENPGIVPNHQKKSHDALVWHKVEEASLWAHRVGCRIEVGGQSGLEEVYSRWWHVFAWLVLRLRGWSASFAGLVGLVQHWAAPGRFWFASLAAAPAAGCVGAQGGLWYLGCPPCSAALGEGAA